MEEERRLEVGGGLAMFTKEENSTGRDRQDRATAWAHVPLWQVPHEEVEGGALRLSEG